VLDGSIKIKDLVTAAQKLKMPAIALTDHGNMFGAVEFYQEAVAAGVKPILGCEVYVTSGSRHERTGGMKNPLFHLVLLARNEEGYANLIKLVSKSYLEGFYYKPRVDREILQHYSAGLMALSGCLQGEVSYHLRNDNKEAALDAANWYRDVFGQDNFYLELQYHGLSEQRHVLKSLVTMSKVNNFPLVATNDVHYIKKEDSRVHDALLCIQTQSTVAEEDRFRMPADEFYFKSPEEMKSLFSDIAPESISNTVTIAERCNVRFDFGKPLLPVFPVPEGVTLSGLLEQYCQEGLAKRYPAEKIPEVQKRLDFELGVIRKMGFDSYFLIVSDFIQWAKDQGIPVGPGRGSAAGSVVSYLLGVTDIDPLKYRLFFERFLNPERAQMPDIDIDFCKRRRDEVIDYVRNKYGKNSVSQIITFGTLGAKAAIRDVGRVLGFPYADIDRIAKLIPLEIGITLQDALKKVEDLRKLEASSPEMRQLIEIAKALEGVIRNVSTHAAGVVIADGDLMNYVPLYRSSDSGDNVTQFDMKMVETVGLLKIDFLGLKNLTIIDDAVKLIRKTREIDLDINTLPLDDEQSYRLLCEGHTAGVFQLESSGMRDLTTRLKPSQFEDLIAILALYRPGPLRSGMVDDYIKRKHGKVKIKHIHKRLEHVLEETYGVILYQEQVMQIAAELAGFTMAEADKLRKAMGKKIAVVMEEQGSKFVAGASKRGLTKKRAEQIFELMASFAEYGFNKSHSTAYAMISYRTAYLKAHYPVEFIAALLTSEMDNLDKIAMYIEEARRMDIEVLPPDVNESFIDFTPIESRIRFGLGAVKNVGRSAAEAIITARREHGQFTSLEGFCEHVPMGVVNKRATESLIRCGALDSLGLSRSQMLEMLEDVMKSAHSVQKDREVGQITFMDMLATEDFSVREVKVPDIPEFPRSQLLTFEMETLGLYLSGHPLDEVRSVLEEIGAVSIASLKEKSRGTQIVVAGRVTSIKTKTTRFGEEMGILNLEDYSGKAEVTFFAEAYKKCRGYIISGELVVVHGRINKDDDEIKIQGETVRFLDDILDWFPWRLDLEGEADSMPEEKLKNIKTIFQEHSGESKVYFHLKKDGYSVKISVPRRVKLEESILGKLRQMLGKENVRISLDAMELSDGREGQQVVLF